MNVPTMNQSIDAAKAAELLGFYKKHRAIWTKRDMEVARIYRAIAKGQTVIAALQAITAAGLNAQGMPKLAICQAHALGCVCEVGAGRAVFGIQPDRGWWSIVSLQGKLSVSMQGDYKRGQAPLPLIPPQHRPAGDTLSSYHILWEVESWSPAPSRDPYLLRKIGKDAWLVLAAWDLSDVEMAVMRAHAIGGRR